VLSYIELQQYTTSLLVHCAFLHRTSRVHNKSTESGTLCFITQNFKSTLQAYWYPVLSYIELQEYTTKSLLLVPCAFLHRTSRVHNKSTGTLCFPTQNFNSTQQKVYWYIVLSYTELQEYTTSLLSLVPCALLHRTSRVHCKSTGTMCFLTQNFRNT
jgi:hypothetical protein